jgi:hypothetical protein
MTGEKESLAQKAVALPLGPTNTRLKNSAPWSSFILKIAHIHFSQ